MNASLRIGVVCYANALPLEQDLGLYIPKATIVRDVPSALAKQLQHKELDVAMLSSIELMRHPEYGYIPGLGVCSDGPVRSVCLFSKKPPAEVESVALDRSSLTSVTTVRILYEKFWKHTPRYVSFSPPVENGLRIADAALTIGDPALRFQGEGVEIYDLGEYWRQYCNRPFVYAVWITREGIDPTEWQSPFTQAAVSALQKVDALAEQCTRNSPLPKEFFLDYFTHCIHYHMSDRDLDGMHFFFEQARHIQPFLPESIPT